MNRRTVVGAVVWAVALVALALPAAAAASALDASDDVSSGQWYIDAFHIPEAQAAGWDGSGVTIAVIDGTINTEVPTLANANITVHEPSFCLDPNGDYYPAHSTALEGPTNALHGTAVASMIVGTGDGYSGQQGVTGVAPQAKVLFYAAVMNIDDTSAEVDCDTGPDSKAEDGMAMAMMDAMDHGADIISVSLGANGSILGNAAVIRAAQEGVVIVGALPNEFGLHAFWPASSNGAIAVNSIDASAGLQQDSIGDNVQLTTVFGPGVGILSQGAASGTWEEQDLASGTSYATPVVAGFLALAAQKYPDATGNQLIQSLIHNTGVSDHELSFDDTYGYGIASATHMLAVDPASYPDENPLLTVNGIPSLEEIAAAPTATPSAEPQPSEGVVTFPAWVLIAIVGFIVLVIAVALIIAFAVRRANRTNAGPR